MAVGFLMTREMCFEHKSLPAMVQTERKTRYHKPVWRVDNYMLLNKKKNQR